MTRSFGNWILAGMIVLVIFPGAASSSIVNDNAVKPMEIKSIPVSTGVSMDSEYDLDSGASDAVQNKSFANLHIIDDIATIKAGFGHPDDLAEDVMIDWKLYAWNAATPPVLLTTTINQQLGTGYVEVNTQMTLPAEIYDYYYLECKYKLYEEEKGWVFLFTGESRWSRIAPYNGIWERTGEVTSSSAILQTYLTEKPAFDATEETTLRVPPMAGSARFTVYRDSELLDMVADSGYQPVDDYILTGAGWRRTNYNFRWAVTGLEPDTLYYYRLETRSSDGVDTRQASNINSFQTTPLIDSNEPFAFVVTHCLDVNHTAYPDDPVYEDLGVKVFASMLEYDDQQPRFVIMQGDTIYYDGGTSSEGYTPYVGDYPNYSYIKRWLIWYAQYQYENLMHFFQQIPGYWQVDDHDYWMNNINEYMPDGWLIFRNVNPTPGGYGTTGEDAVNYYADNPYFTSNGDGEKYWRSIRWGQHLEIFLEEGRNYRDYDAGLIWDVEQREWLEQQIHESDAIFKIIAATTPIIGPVIPDEFDPSIVPDKHANEHFRAETELFLNNIRDVENVFFLAGDRHYKYHSTVNSINYPELSHFQEFGSGSAAAPPHAILGGVPNTDLATLIYSDGVNGPGASAGYIRIEINPLPDRVEITFKLIRVTEELDNDVVYQYTVTEYLEPVQIPIYLPLVIK